MSSTTTTWSLRRDPDFFQRATRLFHRLATLFLEESDKTKIVVIVPKTCAPLAADRNQLKRRTREILKNYVFKRPVLMVLVMRRPAPNLPFEELKTQLLSFLHQKHL